MGGPVGGAMGRGEGDGVRVWGYWMHPMQMSLERGLQGPTRQWWHVDANEQGGISSRVGVKDCWFTKPADHQSSDVLPHIWIRGQQGAWKVGGWRCRGHG